MLTAGIEGFFGQIGLARLELYESDYGSVWFRIVICLLCLAR